MGILISPLQKAGLALQEKRTELKAIHAKIAAANYEPNDALKSEWETAEKAAEELSVRLQTIKKYDGLVDPSDDTELKSLDAKFRLAANEADANQKSYSRRDTFAGVKHFKGYKTSTETRDPEEQAYRFMKWILAEALQYSPHFQGTQTVADAVKFCRQNGIEGLKAMSENVNTAGGALVPIEFLGTLIDLREKYGVARTIVTPTPMSSDVQMVPRRTGGVTTYWIGEGATITDSSLAFDQVQLTAKKLVALGIFSSELGEDAMINIGDRLAKEIAYGLGLAEDDAFFNGDGSNTYGKLVGLSASFKGKGATYTNTAGLVTATGTGYATSYGSAVLTDFEAVQGLLPLYADDMETCWVAHRSFYFNVMQKLMLAQGGVTAQETADGRRIPMFLGYPVKFAQKMPAVPAVNQICTYLGNYDMGVSFGTRRELALAYSSEYKYSTDQLAVRGTERLDINVHDVGNYSATATSRVPGPIVGLITAGS